MRASTSYPQVLNWNYERSLIVPFDHLNDQWFISSFFDDNQLLPGQSRITHIIFEHTDVPISCNNKQLFRINHKIHPGFTPNEVILIENALEIISNRLFKPEILENMYNICGTSKCYVGVGVWSRSQLEKDPSYLGKHDLLRYQMMCLKTRSEKGSFPPIHVYPIYEKSDTQAVGTVGCISCISHGSTFSIKGKFEVKLNRYHLEVSADKKGLDPVYWSGNIVHEMLHNLGHKHRDDDYTDNWQINVFENCFVHNGNYSI
jgi:hypothetical protein